jgi:hypothetical protein
VIALASKAKTKGRREEILKDKGLHNVDRTGVCVGTDTLKYSLLFTHY